MYLSDIHTHSIASGHGTSCTISDMAKEASRKGLKLLGISDHGPGTLASGTSSYFRSLPFCPRKRFGIELFYGVELNILDTEGHIDLSDELLNNLDYAIISMHRQNYRSGSVSENTQAYINAMKHPAVKVLGHCDDSHFPVDYDALARAAQNEHVIFEINEASLTPGSYRGDTRRMPHRSCTALSAINFLSFFPVTATAPDISEISQTQQNLSTSLCFPNLSFLTIRSPG